MDFPKIDELKDVAERAIKKDDSIRGENAEYNALSDNIETAGSKDILAFSFDKDIDSKLRELNRCIVLKTAFGIDWICEAVKREEPFLSAKMLAYLNRSENGMIIKTNDPRLSDFIFAFMRMNNLQSRIDGGMHSTALMEFSPKGLTAEIGVPIGYLKNMNLVLDSFEYFLDTSQGFYLLEKRIYTDRSQWEKDLGSLVKNMLSHLAGTSVVPEGALEAVLRRSDSRRRDEIEPVVREALKDIEGRKTVEEHREWVSKMDERKRAAPIGKIQEGEKLQEKGWEKETVTLKRRTIFDKYPSIHKRRKIGEE